MFKELRDNIKKFNQEMETKKITQWISRTKKYNIYN